MTLNTHWHLSGRFFRPRTGTVTRARRKIAALAWILASLLSLTNCGPVNPTPSEGPVITPRVVTERVRKDSDDPAIWIDPHDPSKSLIIGTDKHETNGGLFVFGLDGRIIANKSVSGLKRPNNVDVEYGLILKGAPTDIAVATERYTNKLRVYQTPRYAGDRQRGYSGVRRRPPSGSNGHCALQETRGWRRFRDCRTSERPHKRKLSLAIPVGRRRLRQSQGGQGAGIRHLERSQGN